MRKPFPIVRQTYYLFIFSIPIETLDIGIEGGWWSLSKIVGYGFLFVALLQPDVCFRTPPKVLRWFALYVVMYVTLGLLEPPDVTPSVVATLGRHVQMLLLFWISCNLLQDRDVIKGALLAFGASCVLLSFVQIGGVAANLISQGRVSALSQDA